MAKDKPQKPRRLNKNEGTEEKSNDNSASSSSAIWQDERFQHLVSDPRFRGIPKVQRKVKIDKRFQSMFTDEKFKVKYTVDKYGRRVNKSNAEDLRKYYELNSSDSEAEEDVKERTEPAKHEDSDGEAQEELERRKEEKAISRDADHSGVSMPNEEEQDENDKLASDGEDVPKTLKERLLDPDIDYARGEGRLITDSSSDDESSEEEDPEANIDHIWGELDQEAETTEESTNRLAVCNMDWDRIRAVDLMVLFSSFLPPGGSVLSVTIYPSEFGKERMQQEEIHGPAELVGLGNDINNEKNTNFDNESDEEIVKEQDSDAEEGDDYHMEKLRQYQLNRLRYYYAVAVFDSVATADKIYKECDGIEYESSATRVDLRFIPNGTSFDEDEPTDVCTDLPDTNSYKPRQFTTTALQQAKVDLTWDETALERQELGEKLASGKLNEVSDKELRKMIAYSSEDEEEDSGETEESGQANGKEHASESNDNANQAQKTERPKRKKDDIINKYKALLAEINEKEEQKKKNKFEMEISWNVDEKKDDKDKEAEDSEDSKKKPQLTPIEKVLQKRSERNKQRKEERKKNKMQARGLDPDADDSADSDSIPDGIDMNDPYFAEEFATGDYIDPKAKKCDRLKKQQNESDKQQAAEEEERQAKELQLLLDEDDLEEQGKQHFSLDKILKSEQETKSKRKRRKQLKKSKSAIAEETKPIEDNFQLNLNDERFKAVFTSPKFNIDPTDSHFKKTKAMELLIQEKFKRRHDDESLKNGNNAAVAEVEAKRPKKQLENTLLVKSLKRKIQMKQQK
ncbi:PREDICTED: ESF1 homolog [Rhagoletis zephyria]|uniref:ESF1 homolog n=1 Tax=Rhagoletis zephyria TaxID=28612 RepID=UPI00081128B6|nr:PREDICTED: ESF1 homolog [Rhagoletis zephyria]